LHQLGSELQLLRSGGPASPPAASVDAAGTADRDRRIADLERLVERLLAAHGPPAEAEPKNRPSK